MEIREFANGTFQVWHGNKVLRPVFLEWEPNYQSQHDFMFFGSIREAKHAIINVSNKEKITAIHKVEITEVRQISQSCNKCKQ